MIKNKFAEKLAKIEKVTERETENARGCVEMLKNYAETTENAETGKSEKAICRQFARLYKRAAALIEKGISDGADETENA